MLYIFKKQRKTHGDFIILHLCTKNLDEMIYSPPCPHPKNLKNQNFVKKNKITGDLMYNSWDMEWNGQNFFFISLDHFLPFYPLTT